MLVHLSPGKFSIVIFQCGIYAEVLFEDCVHGLKHYACPSVNLDVPFPVGAFRSTGQQQSGKAFCHNTSRHQIEEGCFGCLFSISTDVS